MWLGRSGGLLWNGNKPSASVEGEECIYYWNVCQMLKTSGVWLTNYLHVISKTNECKYRKETGIQFVSDAVLTSQKSGVLGLDRCENLKSWKLRNI